MVMSEVQHAGQNHNIKIGNELFERAAMFRYLKKMLTNQNSIHKEIESK
jgi:hypothetical protein